jgi:hypothetical protein
VASKLAGSEQKRMLQLRNTSPNRNSSWAMQKRRPGPNAGKANVLGEESSESTLGAAGVGTQTREER